MYWSEKINETPYAMPIELDWVRNHAYLFDNMIMLGAGPGVLAIAFAEGNDEAPIAIVDIVTTHWASTHLRAAGVNNKLSFVISDSAEWANSMPGEIVDFLIVDAAHDQASVERDIDAWFPHMKPGGFIFFHDYLERENGFSGHGEWEKSGVARAIESRSNLNWELVEQVGISIVYRKIQ